jgi:hypothetical protein
MTVRLFVRVQKNLALTMLTFFELFSRGTLTTLSNKLDSYVHFVGQKLNIIKQYKF